jgi:hypothetical protein
MTEYEIRKGLPIPRGHQPASRFALHTMEVGDCMEVSAENKSALQNAVFMFKKKNPGWGFVQHKTTANKYGFWCTARPDTQKAPAPEVKITRPPKAEAAPTFQLKANERIHQVLKEEREQGNPTGARTRELAKLTPAGKRTVVHK